MTTSKAPRKASVHKREVTPPSPIVAALKHFKKVDPLLYRAALPHREDIEKSMNHRREYRELFAALAGSIVSQQLSTKAADTIWARLEKACKGAVTPEAILRLRVTTMRKAGLSGAKTKSLKELSTAIHTGVLDLESLSYIPESEAIVKLSAVWGIGTWTAEMFLMFALEREDIFSVGDLGLRRSVEALYSLPKDAPLKDVERIALVWAPHRSFASRVLWRVRDAR